MTYTEKELDQFLHGISLSLLSKKSAQHWRYDEETAKEIEWLEALERKVRADKADCKTEQTEVDTARAIVHKMIDNSEIAEDAYPDLRQRLHDAVDEYEPQTEREGEQMIVDKVKIKCETEGFEEATEQIETLAEAYDGFPAQVTVKNCHHCKIDIYPSQTKIVDAERGQDE